MGYTILYDRRSIRLKDGRYILMMQTGSSNVTVFNWRGNEVYEKSWDSLHLINDEKGKVACSLEEMKQRIVEYSTNYDYIAKSRGNFFQSQEEMQIFLESGLKRPYSFDEYRAAGNHFEVVCWNYKDASMVCRSVKSEEEMESVLKEFTENIYYERVGVKFAERELKPIIRRSHRSRYAEMCPERRFFIRFDDDDGLQPYFQKKTKTRFIFTYSLDNARIFKTKESAQQYKNTLLALKPDAKFSVVEYGAPEAAKSEMVAE